MPSQAPTVDDILHQTLSGVLWGCSETLHQWRTDSGVIEVSASKLRPTLEAAYDPNMPDWVSLISHNGESFHIA